MEKVNRYGRIINGIEFMSQFRFRSLALLGNANLRCSVKTAWTARGISLPEGTRV